MSSTQFLRGFSTRASLRLPQPNVSQTQILITAARRRVAMLPTSNSNSNNSSVENQIHHQHQQQSADYSTHASSLVSEVGAVSTSSKVSLVREQ